jgi:hypothetical protein
MAVLKLSRHNQNKEIDFELDYLMSLTIKQRFAMMQEKSRQIIETLIRYGHRKTPQIIKRK